MKTKLPFIILVLIVSVPLFGQSTGNCVTDAILAGYSPRTFNSKPVTDQQLEIILKCGIKSPSARNNQPWRFTVVRTDSVMKKIIPDINPANVVVIISGSETNQASLSVEIDCALATESMFVAAGGLGLGARIYGSPVSAVNANRTAFQIPAGFKPVVILRVGNIDKPVDAVSAATTRKTVNEIVNFYK